MRINKYVALATGLSRRKADELISTGQVFINKHRAASGQVVTEEDSVYYNTHKLLVPDQFTTIMLHKPTGYVCSRNGQGSKTIYDLLPIELHTLKPVGRLDKDSSGLLLLTNNGELANILSHPKHAKIKVYNISLNTSLTKIDWSSIHEQGIQLEDGTSRLFLERIKPFDDKNWQVTMREGRNRQIRRTFAAVGYDVTMLHRIQFGTYVLGTTKRGSYQYM